MADYRAVASITETVLQFLRSNYNPTDFDLKMNTFAAGNDMIASAGAPQQGYSDEMTRMFGTS